MRPLAVLFGICSGLATMGVIFGALAATDRPSHAVIIAAVVAVGALVGWLVTRRLDQGARRVAAEDKRVSRPVR
jgi:predicted membrane-bound spermidine synthase